MDWGAHRRVLRVAGRAVNLVELGSGPPLLFVHGLGGSWQNWLENLPELARDHRVVALDLPGFGASEMPAGPISVAGYARTLDAVCTALSIEAASVVGNSMGGFVAAELAIAHPQRVRRLVLVSAAGISSAETLQAPILTIGRVATALATNSAARHRRLAARPITRHMSLALVARHPRLLKADLAYEGFFKGAGKPGFHDAFRACLEYDFRDRLPEIRQPTLIVWGEKDSIIPVKDAAEFERLIPDSRKVVMRDTGHIPMAERPATFNDLMMDFLVETGPASAKEAVEGESQAA